MPVPLLLDVDTGIDDALALLYACASPEAELVAVTCIGGNTSRRTRIDRAGSRQGIPWPLSMLRLVAARPPSLTPTTGALEPAP